MDQKLSPVVVVALFSSIYGSDSVFPSTAHPVIVVFLSILLLTSEVIAQSLIYTIEADAVLVGLLPPASMQSIFWCRLCATFSAMPYILSNV